MREHTAIDPRVAGGAQSDDEQRDRSTGIKTKPAGGDDRTREERDVPGHGGGAPGQQAGGELRHEGEAGHGDGADVVGSVVGQSDERAAQRRVNTGKVPYSSEILARVPKVRLRLQNSVSKYIRVSRFSKLDRAALKFMIEQGDVELCDTVLGRAYRLTDGTS